MLRWERGARGWQRRGQRCRHGKGKEGYGPDRGCLVQRLRDELGDESHKVPSSLGSRRGGNPEEGGRSRSPLGRPRPAWTPKPDPI